jgi:hypothetical protein
MREQQGESHKVPADGDEDPSREFRKLLLKSLGVLLALTGVLIGGAIGVRAAFGSGDGGKCNSTAGCLNGHTCISNRCRMDCDEDADCDEGWHCGKTRVRVTTTQGASRKESDETMKICFPPK